MNASKHGSHCVNTNLQFTLHLFVKFTLFVTQCSRLMFVNSGKLKKMRSVRLHPNLHYKHMCDLASYVSHSVLGSVWSLG